MTDTLSPDGRYRLVNNQWVPVVPKKGHRVRNVIVSGLVGVGLLLFIVGVAAGGSKSFKSGVDAGSKAAAVPAATQAPTAEAKPTAAPAAVAIRCSYVITAYNAEMGMNIVDTSGTGPSCATFEIVMKAKLPAGATMKSLPISVPYASLPGVTVACNVTAGSDVYTVFQHSDDTMSVAMAGGYCKGIGA